MFCYISGKYISLLFFKFILHFVLTRWKYWDKTLIPCDKKIVAVNRRLISCMYGTIYCSSPVPYPDLLTHLWQSRTMITCFTIVRFHIVIKKFDIILVWCLNQTYIYIFLCTMNSPITCSCTCVHIYFEAFKQFLSDAIGYSSTFNDVITLFLFVLQSDQHYWTSDLN